MTIEVAALLRDLRASFSRVPFSRLRYLTRFASEEELVDFFSGLLIKAGDAKHAGAWDDVEAYLEAWEARLMARHSQHLGLPQIAGVPWAPLAKPVRQARIALVTTGGVYVDGQPAFEPIDDVSFRVIPKGTPQEAIRVFHRGYDITWPQEDVSCVFPLHRFQELEQEGAIGSMPEKSYSFMGLINNLDALARNAQEVAKALQADGADAVFFTAT